MKSLPFRLLLGVVIGILVGLVANEGFMNIVVTVKYILGQLINFCVPLIVIGFIAPSITKLGNNASRMLGVAVVIAYVSSILAALGSMAAGYAIIPVLSIVFPIPVNAEDSPPFPRLPSIFCALLTDVCSDLSNFPAILIATSNSLIS